MRLQKEEREGSFWEEFLILLLLQNTTNTQASSQHNSTHEGFIYLSWVTHIHPPKMVTPWQERHLFLNLVLLFLWKRKAPTYTHPLISDSLLEGLKHLKRRQWDDRGGNKMGGGGYIKADLQGLFQHQSATSFFLSHYSSDTNMHTYTHGLSRRVTNTHFDVFFPRCINKKNLWMLVPCFWWRGFFPTSLPNTMRTCERTEWLCLEGNLQENAAKYREMIPSVGFSPLVHIIIQMHKLRVNTQYGYSIVGTSTLTIAHLDPWQSLLILSASWPLKEMCF